MKSILILVFLITVCFSAKSQYTTEAQLVGIDTLNGADTSYIATGYLKRFNDFIGLQVKCTQLGGTSDGSVIIQASIDNEDWVDMISTDYLVYTFPNDTLTIADGAVGLWNILGLPNNYYRTKSIGTVNDTTEIKLKVLTKTR